MSQPTKRRDAPIQRVESDQGGIVIFFDSWHGIVRILIVGPLAYVFLVALLRTSGKRTLAKLKAFDFVVTVALGSILATMLLSKSVPLFEGMTGLVVLTGLQYLVAWLSVRSPRFKRLVTAEPAALLKQGRFLEAAMLRHRVNQGDVCSALRACGLSEPSQAAAVFLEADGSLTVIKADMANA